MTFVPPPGAPTIVELATQLWGEPNTEQSTRTDIRFGTKGSKSVKPAQNTWFDYQEHYGGGYIDLHVKAKGEPPSFQVNGNGKLPSWEDIAAIYEYRGADGRLVLQAIRTITGAPRFRQRTPDASQKHGWNWKGVQAIPVADRPLYRLPELLAAPKGSRVFIPEGEKDVDNVIKKLTLVATCNLGGAAEHKDSAKPYHGKWHPAWSRYLRGHDAVILADNDAPGEDHALDIAKKSHGIARTVRILRLPGLGPKGDVSDWIAAGGTREELNRLADEAPVYEPPPGNTPIGDPFEAEPEPEPPPEWEAEHPFNEAADPKERSRHIINILALVRHIRNTRAWDGVLRFNMLTQNIEIWPPFPPEQDPANAPRSLRDPYDLLLATMYFQANGFAKAGKNMAMDALAVIAHENAYHPVRDYLNGLKWDGIQRVGKLFQHYFNASMPDDPAEYDRHVAYLEHTSTGFMIGAVARAQDPGCKVDHIPVVVGRKQGMLKSTAIRALCHDPNWFSDDISTDLIDRDTKESLSGKWIIELAEIPHIRRETEKMKAFFSRREDRYRSAYGRVNQDHPRQNVFIGTSNDLEFVDVTGNRRFWPFTSAGEIAVAALERDRDQLWAEAMALYRDGTHWWLSSTIERLANEQQDAFVEADVWEELIAEWLIKRNHAPFTMADLFAKETGITPYRELAATQRADEMRAGRCLIKLGWSKVRCTLNAKRGVWWQFRPSGAADTPRAPLWGEEAPC
jgi:hypothetical protein